MCARQGRPAVERGTMGNPPAFVHLPFITTFECCGDICATMSAGGALRKTMTRKRLAHDWEFLETNFLESPPEQIPHHPATSVGPRADRIREARTAPTCSRSHWTVTQLIARKIETTYLQQSADRVLNHVKSTSVTFAPPSASSHSAIGISPRSRSRY
jgi:hypothetical protein